MSSAESHACANPHVVRRPRRDGDDVLFGYFVMSTEGQDEQHGDTTAGQRRPNDRASEPDSTARDDPADDDSRLSTNVSPSASTPPDAEVPTEHEPDLPTATSSAAAIPAGNELTEDDSRGLTKVSSKASHAKANESEDNDPHWAVGCLVGIAVIVLLVWGCVALVQSDDEEPNRTTTTDRATYEREQREEQRREQERLEEERRRKCDKIYRTARGDLSRADDDYYFKHCLF